MWKMEIGIYMLKMARLAVQFEKKRFSFIFFAVLLLLIFMSRATYLSPAVAHIFFFNIRCNVLLHVMQL